jgi:hypothetical protein
VYGSFVSLLIRLRPRGEFPEASLRHLPRLLTILVIMAPVVFGFVAGSLASPCEKGHGHSERGEICACCDKVVLTAAPCAAICHAGLASVLDGSPTARDVRRVSYPRVERRMSGLDLEPLIPPPR